ncbi:cysteine desulfurase-like protein [Zavarzinella formosa]|uniref:cysteine desulfurase-like protein n=1 Tax=Zavarzinella formosa TaxID=360055 RepID=UPI00035C5A16|nr:cysteine desulfurase-like protein [Zavarzinella formosa]
MKFRPEWARSHFPALDRPAVFLDGPAGSQVPRSVIDAISSYYAKHNANHGGCFRTSRESDAVTDWARRSCADLLGVADPECVVFGANMTTLTFAFSRAIATEWQPGDEIMVTRLDHDANVSPWVRAAQDRGVTVRHIAIHPEDCTLDQDDFRRQLSSRTKLVAIGCVSNAVGTRNPVAEMTKIAHEAGAMVFLDAVHHAPHLAIDAAAWDCDFVCCSAYKFFGPHVGVMYGKREHLERLPAYKVRPCPETLPDRWMTGTQNFAAIAGVGAAIEYLSGVGRSVGVTGDRRAMLLGAFEAIEAYERHLGAHMLAELATLKQVKVHGITDLKRMGERVPTVSFTHAKKSPAEVAEFLGERDIFVWSGNYYALPLTEALGVEPHGMVRVGLLHYNTAAEVNELIHALRELE